MRRHKSHGSNEKKKISNHKLQVTTDNITNSFLKQGHNA